MVIKLLTSVCRYANRNLQEKLQKVTNEIAQVFGVHMIAVTVRKSDDEKTLVSMYVESNPILVTRT